MTGKGRRISEGRKMIGKGRRKRERKGRKKNDEEREDTKERSWIKKRGGKQNK